MWDGGGYTVSLKSHILSITGKTRKNSVKNKNAFQYYMCRPPAKFARGGVVVIKSKKRDLM